MNPRDYLAIDNAVPMPDADAVELTIKPTPQIYVLNGVPGRVWKGTAANGGHVVCLIAQVWLDMRRSTEAQDAEFRRALEIATEPRSVDEPPDTIDLRLIL